jgi:S-DNA-T family DNA segregation ATPase FtsK/SpoIIIE
VVWIAWNWVRRRPIETAVAKGLGTALLIFGGCIAFELGPHWSLFGGAVSPGGLAGLLLADGLRAQFNLTGAALVTCACLLVGVYLTTRFRLSHTAFVLGIPAAVIRPVRRLWRPRRTRQAEPPAPPEASEESPFETEPEPEPELEPEPAGEIPIRTLDDLPPRPAPQPEPVFVEPVRDEPAASRAHAAERPAAVKKQYELPATDLLNEPPGRSAYDEEELKQIAIRIKAKFEEFNVFGSVVQINPGPVVTTFEFKPEAGIKYNRITALTEDLCLGLQAESILIERIPGKPTVGIEVPNARRELIALRQILEADEFAKSQSRLTVPLGKDISGRIKVTPLEAMPHLLIAGSTGSGKSVMLNTLIMSVLYKATPDDVRMILVDPKRLELGLYEGIPHLLTPVITDAKKATNALRNAVLEMERRLRLLASQGVRNIEQFNRKVRQLRNEPIPLFEDSIESAEELEELPYILILIDELADLMMVEGHNVEQSVTRLAQMARAVGMHLVLATQRPSVDVITGLIKANFPARISFRVATRVDSRTVLDVMGAEHLLGKGDMLHLPPGSSRLIRMHASFVTETEINRVVEFWRAQATPDYDQSFLIAPPEEGEEQEGAEAGDFNGEEDPLYHDAVRVVIEMGKASTSTLQRRLRLGYGRAARILDMMQRDGIIGPPDGSKPREVLKRPDWFDEVEERE